MAAKAVGEIAAAGKAERDQARPACRARARRRRRRSRWSGRRNGRPVGGGSSRSTWPRLSRPSRTRPRIRTPRAVIRPTCGPVRPKPDPDLDPPDGGIGAARIADDEIFEDLAAEADPPDLIARLDAAAGELAVDIAGRERDPVEPDDGEPDEEQDQQDGERYAPPAPAGAARSPAVVFPLPRFDLTNPPLNFRHCSAFRRRHNRVA